MSEYRILHTSDWHLGKRLFKADRTQEHIHFLDWLHQYIIDQRINLLLIAGDIFDVPSPPNSAQKIFYDFIYKLGQIDNLKTIIITGNHDSPSLFEIPKSFFKKHNCYIFSSLYKDLNELNHIIEFENKKIGIKSLPYFRNFELTNHLSSNDDEKDIESFFKQFFNQWEEKPDHTILVSHHGFGKYAAAGSEHAIFLSGLDHFPLDWVKESFDYVALGHIHKKQKLCSDPPIIYPGSPIPLRFSESNKKYISQVTIDSNSNIKQEEIEIPNSLELIQITANHNDYKEQILNLLKNVTKPVYLEVIIKLDAPKSGIADEIRSLLKDTSIELISYIPMISHENKKQMSFDELKRLDLGELFKNYYKQKFPSEQMSDTLYKNFNELVSDINNETSPN